MASDGIYVIAHISPKAAHFDEVLEGLKQVSGAVEANEPGCLLYELYANKENNKIIVYEKYKDMDAFKAHAGSDHMKQAREQGGAQMEKEPELHFVTSAGGFTRS